MVLGYVSMFACNCDTTVSADTRFQSLVKPGEAGIPWKHRCPRGGVRLRAKVLIVEDDPLILDIMRLYLEKAGHDVHVRDDGPQGLEAARRLVPDVVVLDIMLPGLSGLELLSQLRSTSTVPVLIVTARDRTPDKVHGLRLGADDYLVKPFDPEELVARVDALLRRSGRLARPVATRGDLVVDPVEYRAAYRGQDLGLSPREVEMLHILVSAPNRTFTRQQLLDLVWGPAQTVDERAVDTAVTRLRRKLEQTVPSGEGLRVETVWGVGYKFAVDP